MNLGNRHSQHSFAQIPAVNSARSSFNRSFAVKDTFNFDYLVPILVDEILPGDTVNINVKTFARLATQVVPLLDNMYLDFFAFFCPNRLVWDKWERFNGAQENPGDSTDFLVPHLEAPAVTGFVNGSIFDKMGLPTQVPGIQVNALPFRMYNLIYNTWFRDQNLQNSVTVLKTDGPDPVGNYQLLKRAKKHDYFTSALPFPQKGATIGIPLGGLAPVKGIGMINDAFSTSNQAVLETGGITPVIYPNSKIIDPAADATRVVIEGSAATGVPQIYADLSAAASATINSLRLAFMLQSMNELDARGGTRYVEILKAHFNVISPDFRLQRPEFLSASTVQIAQHPVAQNSETGTTPQGNLAAFSTAAEFGNKIGFSKSFVEHGWIFILVQARGEVTYQQGVNRMWSRRTRWDYFWPKLQELGEQTILNKEIYAQGTIVDNGTFGWQERFAEYRYRPSEIRGQFRSNYSETLDVWHLAEEFESLPALNGTFIQSSTPIERSLVVPDENYPQILFDCFFQYTHARPMVTYGVPATLGRF